MSIKGINDSPFKGESVRKEIENQRKENVEMNRAKEYY